MKPSRARQTTLASPVEASGIGLHTAVPVNVRLTPAPLTLVTFFAGQIWAASRFPRRLSRWPIAVMRPR